MPERVREWARVPEQRAVVVEVVEESAAPPQPQARARVAAVVVVSAARAWRPLAMERRRLEVQSPSRRGRRPPLLRRLLALAASARAQAAACSPQQELAPERLREEAQLVPTSPFFPVWVALASFLRMVSAAAT